MNNTLSVALTAVLALASASVLAQGPARTGGLPAPANRIVGLWDTQPAIKPCGSPAPAPSGAHTTLLFAAGGTWVENPRYPPAGVANAFGVPGQNQRSGGLGTWSYNPLTARYTAHMQFDWYVDGAYHGYQTVDRSILLNNDGTLASGPVKSTRYAADGSVILALCGSAIGSRL